jgi:3,4-dihydroxy 2-butanone 4-phosphate synthase/GTP cyclohydrolase II
MNTIQEAVQDIRDGRMVIVVDDEDRENEGDLTLAAEQATPEAINFMIRHGRGLVCVAMTGERLDELSIPLMVAETPARYGTAFCVSVEAKHKVSTGISASDRAATVIALVDPKTKPGDLARPGHMFPLRARRAASSGARGRPRPPSTSRASRGLYPAGVICEVMNEDGTMARVPQLERFAAEHGIRMISIADLIRYRMKNESLVRRVAQPVLPTDRGDFRLIAFESDVDRDNHLALVMGDDFKPDEPVMVRVHSECLTGDVFGSVRCDCGPQLERAMDLIAPRAGA